MRVLTEQFLHLALHHRDTRRTTDQNHFVDVGGRDAGVGQCALARTHGALDQLFDELLELRARQLYVQMLGPRRVRGDERQVDVGLHRRGELHLRTLGCFLESLQRDCIFRKVDSLLFLEFRYQPLDYAMIEVVAAQVGIAVGRLYLENAFAQVEDADVERTAAQVVDGDGFVLLLVQSVR